LVVVVSIQQDLLDYLVQLLGSDRQEQLRDFVDDVEQVRSGATLSTVESATLLSPPTATTSTAKAVEDEILKTKSMKIPQKKASPVSNMNGNTKTSGSIATKQQKSYASVVPKKPNATGNVPQKKQSKQTQTSDLKKISQPTKQVKDELSQRQQEELPLQGDATVVCGCFGTMHKALNNCLHCGRISCEREGYGYCPFCRYMVYENRSNLTIGTSNVSTTTMTNNDAWEQKERLLQYDREFAQRTIILDDQADYYNRTTSNWLNEQEQQEAQLLEQQRSDALQKRAKPKLILDI
jgi:hypothetical protein